MRLYTDYDIRMEAYGQIKDLVKYTVCRKDDWRHLMQPNATETPMMKFNDKVYAVRRVMSPIYKFTEPSITSSTLNRTVKKAVNSILREVRKESPDMWWSPDVSVNVEGDSWRIVVWTIFAYKYKGIPDMKPRTCPCCKQVIKEQS